MKSHKTEVLVVLNEGKVEYHYMEDGWKLPKGEVLAHYSCTEYGQKEKQIQDMFKQKYGS